MYTYAKRTYHIGFLVLILCLIGLPACVPDSEEDLNGDTETQTVEDNEIRLTLPASVHAGARFEVGWDGAEESRNYISIAEEGTSGGSTINSRRTDRGGDPLTLRAPDHPGMYEVRYVQNDDDEIQASASIEVTEVDADLDVPSEVGAGSHISVTWTGPDNPRDYISLAEQGSSDGSSVDTRRTSRGGNPLSVRAPDTPSGEEYEIRYVMYQSDRVIARSPITITEATASFDVADTLMVDTPVDIDWEGPDNHRDYISLAEPGSRDDETVTSRRTDRGGHPLTLRMPEQPGEYELRYIMGQEDHVIERKDVVVLPLQARLEAPDSVERGTGIDVSWIGPNGPSDFIAIASPDADPDTYKSRARSRAGSPATVFAPNTPGSYELRYVWAEEDSVLTQQSLEVTEAE